MVFIFNMDLAKVINKNVAKYSFFVKKNEKRNKLEIGILQAC